MLLWFVLSLIVSTGLCALEWGSFSNWDCAGDCVRIRYATLYNIPNIENWIPSCENTPAKLKDVYFEYYYYFSRPSKCVDKFFFIDGEFNVYDWNCCSPIGDVVGIDFEARPQVQNFNEYKSINSITTDTCINECRRDFKCSAVTLNPSGDSHTCYMYEWSTIESRGLNKDLISYFKKPNGAIKHIYDQNYDHYDLKTAYSSSECYRLCEKDRECYVVTFMTKNDDAICYLFHYDKVGTSTYHYGGANYMSIYKIFDDAEHYIYLDFNNDYTRIHSKSAMGCYKACINDNKCAASSHFTPGSDSSLNCRLYDWYSISTNEKEGGMTSVLRPYAEIRKGTRLSNHYKKLDAYSGSECYSFCVKETICVAVTFDHTQSSPFSCHMYNSSFSCGFDNNWTSYFKKPNNSIVETGTRLGGDYYNSDYYSAQLCYKDCEADSKCKVVTFDNTQENGKIKCYFYETYTEGYSYGWISYYKKPQNSEFRRNNRNKDHYKEINTYSSTKCFNECIKENDCYFITYFDHGPNTGSCYFYNYVRLGGSTFNPRTVSQYKIINGANFKDNTRNSNHYAQYGLNSGMDCYKKCLQDNKCSSITFKENVGANTNALQEGSLVHFSSSCYLYDWYTDAHTSEEVGYVSIFRDFAEIRKGTKLSTSTYYKKYDTFSVSECFDLCMKDDECKAVAFDHSDQTGTFECFLHTTSDSPSLDNNWTTYFKPHENFTVKAGLRLNDHYYIDFYFSAQECSNACYNDPDCIAISFDNTIENNKIGCFFYDAYGSGSDYGWVSYIHNCNAPVKISV